MLPEVGTRLGYYEVTGLLGIGGMGRVYRARDTRLGRDVALKMLSQRVLDQPSAAERFRREALAASALNHPNIITVYEFIDSECGPVLAMELIEGKTLRQVISESPKVSEALEWCRQMVRALHAAHSSGIIHRDLKPDNIMVRSDRYIKILDFGIARLTPPLTPGMGSRSAETVTQTAPGLLLGTFRYMSPEQLRGHPLQPSSDVFSMGLVWFELLTGQHPFQDSTEVATMNAIISGNPAWASRLNPEIPRWLDDVLTRMLNKEPELRPTAQQLDTEISSSGPNRNSEVFGSIEPSQLCAQTVGRAAELLTLGNAFYKSIRGNGQVVCISGEPGIGKTTLAESFLSGIERTGDGAMISYGRCSERLAGTEAYLPFLESFESLLQAYPDVVRPLMQQHAPMWYVQVGSTTQPHNSSIPSVIRSHHVTQERLKRELHLLFRELSAVRPLILFFDDLHWADPSTVDLLNHAASHFESMRVLVVVTYRLSDMIIAKHSFLSVRLGLAAKGLLTEICLELLNRDDIEKYLVLNFLENSFPPGFASMLHARTEGNPLFVKDLLAYLRDQGIIDKMSGRWVLTRELDEVSVDLPASVRSMVQRKIDQLTDEDRKLLAAASVQGYEFDSAVIADVQGIEAAELEERLDVIDKVHAIVRIVNEDALPDGTLSVRYRFVHVLYQNALYSSLRPTRRRGLCAAVASSLDTHLNGKRDAKAAELAILYETAREFEQAARWFLTAARNAGAKYAADEAVALAGRGLAAVVMLPNSDRRLELNLELQVALAFALWITKGNAAPETGASMLRARELAERAGRSEYVPALLWGLWLYHQVGGDLASARRFAEELLTLANQSGSPDILLEAHTALGITAVHLGQLRTGHAHLEEAIRFHDPSRHAAYVARYNFDPGVYAGPGSQRTLWLMGYADQARARTLQTLSWCEQFADPQSVAFVHVFAAFFYQFCRDSREAGRLADYCTALCLEHGIVQEREWVAPVQGWALARQGDLQEGLKVLRSSLARHRAIQSQLNVPYYLALLIEILLEAGRLESGLEAAEEALQVVEHTQQRSFLAEIYRLKGELLFLRNTDDGHARYHFRQALRIAEEQSARSLQLRAAMGLFRHARGMAEAEEARAILANVYAGFSEGFSTPDLSDARSLLR